ncbi:MAG: LysR substrate-binding domain-containing protein [Geminicoccaceae bacterium]
MKDLPLNALRAFAAIYETGGIRPAARSLNVTHSSISRHLRELENWIGLHLIEVPEGMRSLRFTDQGEALGRSALAGLRELETAVATVREAKRGNSVMIATTPSFASCWLLHHLPDLEATHPWIELSVIVDQRRANPSEQGADFGLRVGRGPWSGLICEPFMDDSLYPVMSPGFWQAAGKPTDPSDLVDLRLLHDRDPNSTWEVWRQAYGPKHLELRSGPRFTATDLVLKAATQGLGVALARDRMVRGDIAAGLLIRPFGKAEVSMRDAYWIVRSENARVRSAANKVIEWLKLQAMKPPAGISDVTAQ